MCGTKEAGIVCGGSVWKIGEGWVAFLPFIASFLPFIASFYAIYCFIFGLKMNGDLGLFKNCYCSTRSFSPDFQES